MSESYAQMTGGTQHLFSQAELSDWLASLQQNCKALIDDAPEETLLGSAADTWADQLAKQYAVEPLLILHGEIEIEDLGECSVDVRGDRDRAILDYSQPVFVPGRRAVAHIPFRGDGKLLRCAPNQRSVNPPCAAIRPGELALEFQWPHDRRPNLKAEIDRLVAVVEQHAVYQASEIARHNAAMRDFAWDVITARRQRVLADREHLDGLGIPIRRRADAPKTYAAPGIARRAAPAVGASTARSQSTPMEPTLVDEFYEHSLTVVSAMARGMERTPGNYATWDEEQLRDALLVMLNTHYEGRATGETFNFSGKTDILIRIEDRNVFVAECKWWSGAAAFAQPDRADESALDQLLGYTTWRDARLALVMFVDRVDIGRVLANARSILERHPAFEHWQAADDEGELRCRVRMPASNDRHADLAVIFVHLPRKTERGSR